MSSKLKRRKFCYNLGQSNKQVEEKKKIVKPAMRHDRYDREGKLRNRTESTHSLK